VIALIVIAARQAAAPSSQDRAAGASEAVAHPAQEPMYGVGPAPWANDIGEWLYGLRD